MALNKEWVLSNLRDAKEELDRTITEIETDPGYEFGELSVAMAHIYHHVNSAWNSREASEQEVTECSEESFSRWRQMPDDIRLASE